MKIILPPPGVPWSQPDFLPSKPGRDTCGYWDTREDDEDEAGKAIESSLQALRERVRVASTTWYVWTPEAPYGVPPAAVPALHPDLRGRERRRGRRLLVGAVVGVALAVLAPFVGLSAELMRGVMLCALLGTIFLALEGLYLVRPWRHNAAPSDNAFFCYFEYWLETTRYRTTSGLVTLLGIVYLGQLMMGPSAAWEEHGLRLAAARDGAWGRLGSAIWLHGHLPHLLINVVALVYLGRRLEALQGRLRLVGIFLLSGLAGSVATLVAGSDTKVYVGASGAISGCLSYLLLLGWQHRKALSYRFLWMLLLGCLAVGVTGAVLPAVNNSGHVGGAFGGVLCFAFFRGPLGSQRDRRAWTLFLIALALSAPLWVEAGLRALR